MVDTQVLIAHCVAAHTEMTHKLFALVKIIKCNKLLSLGQQPLVPTPMVIWCLLSLMPSVIHGTLSQSPMYGVTQQIQLL
jgi:hypothetical protein